MATEAAGGEPHPLVLGAFPGMEAPPLPWDAAQGQGCAWVSAEGSARLALSGKGKVRGVPCDFLQEQTFHGVLESRSGRS